MTDDNWFTASQIADKLKINKGTISTLAKRHNIPAQGDYHHRSYPLQEIEKALSLGNPNKFNARFIEPETHLFTDFWHLDWKQCCIISDTHAPFFNARIYDRLFEIATKRKIRQCIHVGDFFDNPTFSKWPMMSIDEAPSLAFQIKETKKLHDEMSKVFPELYFLMGTHDLRYWRMIVSQGKHDDFSSPFDLIGCKHVSRFPYAEIGQEWRVSHPHNVVKVGGIPSVRMTAKHDRSILVAHGHLMGYEFSPNGKHVIINMGSMVNREKVAYVNLQDTSHPIWVNGFVVLLEPNKPKFLLCNEYSPWEIYLS